MNWFFKNNVEKRIVVLFMGDLLISLFAFFFSAYLILWDRNVDGLKLEFVKAKIIILVITVLFFSFFVELYSTKRIIDKKLLFLRSLLVSVFSFIFLLLAYYLIPDISIGSKMLVVALMVVFVLQCLWHLLYYFINTLPFFIRKVLVLGTGQKAEKVGALLDGSNDQFLFKGYISTHFDSMTVPKSKIIGASDSLVEIVKRERIKTIVMALTEQRGNNVIDKLLTCKLLGINVIDLPSFYELLTGKLPVEDIEPSWLVNSHDLRITRASKIIKRVSDLIISTVVLFLVLPFFPIIALLIKLGSPGPVFYKQLRVGEMEKDFFIYKFRTMHKDAEKETGVAWAQKDDPRTTKVGRFLRKTRLDELPQLFNVLKGDMSFIGPRPERPELVGKIKKVSSFYKERHFLKPGITGWAQIKYPYGASFGDAIEKLRYDLYYIKNNSFFLDMLIVFETIKVVIFRRGGR